MGDLKDICRPLKQIGIDKFIHDITFEKGELSMLTTEESEFKYYYENRLPACCVQEGGRMLAEGVYCSEKIEAEYPQVRGLLANAYQRYGSKKIMHIMEWNENCQHLFTLVPEVAGNKNENDYMHWAVNNISTIRNFIEQYKHEAKDIILEAKAPANRIKLPFLKPLESCNSFAIEKIQTDDSLIMVFHKDDGRLIHLSKQQSKCLSLLMEGQTAKKIGLEMSLSFRTVEHYIARIRKLLGCDSRRDLYVSYGDQLFSK